MLAHALQSFLDANGISKAELARRTGVGRPDISRVLNGKRPRFSVPAAEKLEAYTKIPASTLLGLDASPPSRRRAPSRRAVKKGGAQ
jgi:transcriptional regulator with XRE-family HTH domain